MILYVHTTYIIYMVKTVFVLLMIPLLLMFLMLALPTSPHRPLTVRRRDRFIKLIHHVKKFWTTKKRKLFKQSPSNWHNTIQHSGHNIFVIVKGRRRWLSFCSLSYIHIPARRVTLCNNYFYVQNLLHFFLKKILTDEFLCYELLPICVHLIFINRLLFFF